MVGAVFVVVMLGMAVTFATVEASLIEWRTDCVDGAVGWTRW